MVAKAALDRGNDQADLFPVPQPAHGHAGESAGLGVGERKNFLTSIRHRMSSFFGCSDGKRGSRGWMGARLSRLKEIWAPPRSIHGIGKLVV